MTEDAAPEDTPPNPKRRRRLGRWASAGLVLVLTAVTASGVIDHVIKNPITAPGWARTLVEDALVRAAPDSRVTFGDLRIGFAADLRPQVALDDLEVATAEGAPQFAINTAQATLGARALTRGRVELSELDVSGLSIGINRLGAQEWDLDLGQVPSQDAETRAGDDSATLGGILAEIDGLLQSEALQTLTRAEAQNVHIAYRDLYANQSWSVDGSQIRLTQTDAALAITADVALLTGRGELATVTFDIDQDRVTDVATLAARVEGVAAHDLATQSPALAWMQVIDAPISGAFRLDATETSLGTLNATLSIGQGTLSPGGEARPIQFDGAQTYFSFDAAKGRLTFDLIEFESALGTVSADGFATLQPDADGPLGQAIVAQLAFQELQMAPELWSEAGRDLSGAMADLRITFDPFTLQIGQAVLPVAGHEVVAEGRILGQSEGWDVALDMYLAELTIAEALAFWPDGARPRTRDWFEANMTSARAQNLHLAWRDRPGTDMHFGGTFEFDDLDLRYMRHLPHLTGAAGTGVINGPELALMLEAGTMTPEQGGVVDGAGTTMVFKDLTAKPVEAVLDLNATGALTAFLTTIDNKPFEFLTKAGRPVTLGDGATLLTGQIALPLIRPITPADVTYDLKAEVAGFRTDVIVENHTLTAARADVEIDNSGLRVSGPMQVSGVDVTGTWSMDFAPEARGTSRFEGDVELSPRALDVFRVALPPGTVAGRGTGRLELDLAQGQPPRFRLTSDLRGASLNISALNWSKAPSQSGRLELSGVFGASPNVDDLRLSGPGMALEGRVSTKEGGLDRLDLRNLRVGDWLNAQMTLIGQGRGAPPRVELLGGTLDLRSVPQGENRDQNAPMAIALDRLQISDTIALTNFRGTIRPGAAMAGDFTARINGDAPVSGVMIPSDGGSRIQIVSDDAGAVMRAAGVIPNADGGQMVLNLTPAGREGVLNGAVRVTDTRLRNAPAMASLLSAISVVGLIEQMAGQGLVFSEVEAEFQLTPEDLRLFSSSAVGPSLGLSLDGVYTLGDRRMDMQGVISPIYLLNGIGSIFTRKGEGLFAFNFNMEGPASSPQVSVNPFSILTPGAFREIFRRPPPAPSN